MSKLNAIGQKWVEALRSGNYAQTKESLRDSEGFCCLGVLCDLAEKEGVGEWGGETFYTDNGCGAAAYLPIKVMDWSGVNSDIGRIPCSSLAELNDDGKSFGEIASAIEANAEFLGIAEPEGAE